MQGVEIAHYTFPSLAKLAMQFDDEADLSSVEGGEALMQVFWGANTHLYMVREGKNLIVSTLPQVLIARDRNKTKATVSTWLNEQKVDISSSVFSLTADVDELPKKAYHLYLSGVQSFSDIAGVEPNLMSLPLAEDLGLADSGRAGLAIDTGENHLSLNLNYSQSPLDLFFGGHTLTMVAVMGVLAAVALPAYQDYTIRAKGAEAFVMASQIKLEVAEFYRSEGRFPNENEAQEFAVTVATHNVWFDPESNSIFIDYGGAIPQIAGTRVVLSPLAGESGQIDWHCFSETVPQQYLPSTCRN